MFRAALEANAAHVQAHLDQQLALLETSEVAKAMAYSLQGGKRLRAFLVMQSAALFDIGPSQAIWPACAIEAVHAYSLVHDDLPCMDDDDLRRGKPTLHKQYSESTAVLAGDAMQSTSGWNDGGNGSNSSGWSGLPGGYRYSGTSCYGCTDGFRWSRFNKTKALLFNKSTSY